VKEKRANDSNQTLTKKQVNREAKLMAKFKSGTRSLRKRGGKGPFLAKGEVPTEIREKTKSSQDTLGKEGHLQIARKKAGKRNIC